jgi:flagellar assembly protein FliH
MISLSSIVKARLLKYIPNSAEYMMDYTKKESAAETYAGEETPPYDTNGMIERQEALLNQAVKKSRHVESEAQRRADALIESALKSGREIMDNAEKQGYEEGYLRGLTDGALAAEDAAEESLTELRRLVENFKSVQQAVLKREEKNLLEIAMELSKKILRQQLHSDEDILLKMLDEIVLENEDSVKIYLSEYQKSLDVHLDKTIIKKIKGLSKDSKIVLLKDEDLIMCENESGIVDMSVPVQLEQLKKAIQ